jgi:hypothetical protein
VINSVGVAQAIREGLVVEPQESEDDDVDDESALFIPETNKNHLKSHQDNPFLKLNPKAPAFALATSNTQALRSQSVSSAQTSSNGIESNTTTAPFFPTINSGSAAMTGIFGDTASSKNAFELKTPTVPSTSSIFTFDKETKPAPASFFGAPSFDSSAPSASTPPVAPAAMNNVWPTADVNGIFSTSELHIHFLFSSSIIFCKTAFFRAFLHQLYVYLYFGIIFSFCIALWIKIWIFSRTMTMSLSRCFSQCPPRFQLHEFIVS